MKKGHARYLKTSVAKKQHLKKKSSFNLPLQRRIAKALDYASIVGYLPLKRLVGVKS